MHSKEQHIRLIVMEISGSLCSVFHGDHSQGFMDREYIINIPIILYDEPGFKKKKRKKPAGADIVKQAAPK